ncbi:MAG: GNAT family protein [Hyphomicrobiales bacterium]
MGLLDSFRRSHEPRSILGQGLMLRFPAMEDYAQWLHLRSISRDFLVPWEPSWPSDDLTLPAWRYRIRRYREMTTLDQTYPYFIFNSERRLLGGITLSNVRRGVAQTATLGYWIGEPFARQGHMARALAALLPHAFAELHLHRVEAACLPRNEASIRLLRKSGFSEEGYARAYLQINGRWEDHLLFARLAQDPAP